MKKVLVIEDEIAYVKLLRDKLANICMVLDAQDGKNGLEIAKKKKPDLILLDVRLPVMNGMAVLQELRKDPCGKNIKVIILTNVEANDAIVKQVIRDQPAYYFVKTDIKLDDLLEKIKELLNE